MRTLTVVFTLPDGQVFQLVSIGEAPFSRLTADTAFRLSCVASVHVNGERMPETATTTLQLFSLLMVAAAQGAPACPSCSI